MPPVGKAAEIKEQVLALYKGELEELRGQGASLIALGKRIIGEVEEAVENGRPVQLGSEITTVMHTGRQLMRLSGTVETLQKLIGNFEPGKFPKIQLPPSNGRR